MDASAWHSSKLLQKSGLNQVERFTGCNVSRITLEAAAESQIARKQDLKQRPKELVLLATKPKLYSSVLLHSMNRYLTWFFWDNWRLQKFWVCLFEIQDSGSCPANGWALLTQNNEQNNEKRNLSSSSAIKSRKGNRFELRSATLLFHLIAWWESREHSSRQAELFNCTNIAR